MMADKYIGKLLDNRYEILEVIGTGGMAVVYKALCHRLNRYVAVKILKDEYAKDEQFRNRFHAESHAVAMLQHPNIVAVYDVSRSNSVEYIVMELIDGMTLKQYMERRGVLTQKEAVHFTVQILKALSHAHSRGIIHRDIKPHNIMLLRDSTVKVADFGIARLESSQRTITREAFGSVHYISPEQARGSNIDCRTDIYSTGVVMYEMLTGRLPFEGDTPVSVAIQHINSLPLNPREINPEIPEALEKIIMKAMAPSVSKRYSSADEMLRDIEEFRKNPFVTIDYSAPTADAEEDNEQTRKIEINETDDGDEVFEIADDNKKRGIREKMPLIAAIAAGIIFVAGVVTLVSSFFGGSSKVYKVPNVLGMTIEEASKEYRNFEIIETDKDKREYSNEYDEGCIIKQSPKSDEETSSRKIYVTLSRGKRSDSTVPTELVNMSKEQAQIVADREGFTISFEDEASDDVPEGSIIRTVPEAGSPFGDDMKVTAYISTGKSVKDAVVPYLIGLTEEKAELALRSAKLVKGNVSYENSSTEKGLVIKQSVSSGEVCGEGSSVGITISLGEAKQEPSKLTTPSNPTQKPTQKPSDNSENNHDGNVTITRSIRLPSDPNTFTVKITVNGITQYEKQHSGSDGSVNVSLKGKGASTVCVYINNVLRQEIPIDFK